ncbi:sugar transferase [Patescibacteria group bacterium]
MGYTTVKRIIDIICGALFLILFSPILLITAIAIKLTSEGPVFVEKGNSHMKRYTKGGKVFRLFKFRSMLVNADVLLENNPKFKRLYREYKKSGFKLHKDPRIIKFGRFIRKHSIDEMPQLINVLKGEMSIVGPRPYLPKELDEQVYKYPHTEKYVKEMLTVKPGITGFWQVSGRSNVGFEKRIEMDAYYARKKSILLDLLIMLRTPWVMLTGTGAV